MKKMAKLYLTKMMILVMVLMNITTAKPLVDMESLNIPLGEFEFIVETEETETEIEETETETGETETETEETETETETGETETETEETETETEETETETEETETETEETETETEETETETGETGTETEETETETGETETETEESEYYEEIYNEPESIEPEQQSDIVTPPAGIRQVANENGIIDYSFDSEGYVTVQYTGTTEKKLRAAVEKEDGKSYIYDLKQQVWTTLPITEGSGSYKIIIYENVEDTKYKVIIKESIYIKLSNELNAFLIPNQYAFRSEAVTEKAAELTANAKSDAEKISAIYDYIVNNITYDYEKAEDALAGRTAPMSEYVPNLDEILTTNTGICIDYAALMASMLRSQNIPTKIVVGDAGEKYHAWISVYIEDDIAEISGMSYYDTDHWLHMDPTFASVNPNSQTLLEYINNASNYSARYCY